MYEAYKGKVVHNPGYDLLPGLFDGATEETTGAIDFYLQYAKYENWKLMLMGVTKQQGATLALEIIDYQPYVYLRCSEFPEADSVEQLFREKNAPLQIERQKHWIAPPAPVDGRSDVWKLTFNNWQHLQKAVKEANGSGPKRCNFLQYEQLKYELVYLFERKLQLHGWNTLDTKKANLSYNRLTTCKFEYQCHWDALAPQTKCTDIPLQLIATCDIETIAEQAVKQYQTDQYMRKWIHSQVSHLLLRGYIAHLPACLEDVILAYTTADPNPDKPSLFMGAKANKPRDHCINIATHFFYLRHQEPVLCIRHCLGTVERLPRQNATTDLTLTFDTERDMIMHWVHTVRHTFDAELLAGHNLILYDVPFLYDRAQVLGIGDHFTRLGRFHDPSYQMKELEVVINTKGRGKKKDRRIYIPGVRQFDTLAVALQMHPSLDNHRLTTVVEKLLGEHPLLKKKDLAYEALAPYWRIGGHTRWEIADYNGQDVYLVDELIRKCGLLDFALETSADTSTSLTDVVIRGQSIRCWNQEAGDMFEEVLLDHNMRRRLMRVARSRMSYEERQAYYDPNFAPDNGEDDPVPYEERYQPPAKNANNNNNKKKQGSKKAEKSYRGARLVELKRGLYEHFVLTYDFEGLYPAIDITFRLCFTRYLPHQDLYNHDAATATANFFQPQRLNKKLQTDNAFDQKMVRFPTLPQNTKYYCWFWNDLAIDRIQFKINPASFPEDTYIILVVGYGKERCCFVYEWPRNMKETPKPIVCGSCGSAVHRRGITKNLMKAAEAAGDKLMASKYNAQQLCFKCRANSLYGFHGAREGICEFVFISQSICLLGRILNEFTERTLLHKYNRKCVYGDTDSVMPLLTGVTLEQAHDEAVESCKYITSQLPGVLRLAFENIKSPSIFYTPKGYAYFKVWDEKGRLPKGKLVIQGLAPKRRNYSSWFQKTCDGVLQALMLPEHAGKRQELVLATVSQALLALEKNEVPITQLARSCQVQATYKPNQKLAQKALSERMRRRGQEVPGGSRISFVYTAGSNPLNERAEIPEFVTSKGLELDKGYYRKQLLDNVLKLIEFHPEIVLAFNQQILHHSNAITRYFT